MNPTTETAAPPFGMREALAAMKALGDENRLRIVCLLAGQELCLCQIVEVLSLATSTVSRHMSILQQARLVDSRKQGRWTYFRLAGEDAPAQAREVAALVIADLREDRRIEADRRQLDQILQLDPEALCRRQCQCK